MRQENSNELAFATVSNLRKDGKRSAATLLNESLKSPDRASKILNSYKNQAVNSIKRMNGDEALAIALDCELTKAQYINLRLNSKSLGK